VFGAAHRLPTRADRVDGSRKVDQKLSGAFSSPPPAKY